MNATTAQYRLTDSIEREMLSIAMREDGFRATSVAKNFATSTVRATRALVRFVAEVNADMDKARASSARFTGAQW